MIIFIIAFCVIALFVFMMYACNTDINIVSYDIQTNKIKGRIKIALITDLHSCSYGEYQEKLISQIDIQKPDAIMMSGDIVDDKLPQEKAKQFLSQVSKKYPCYYVTGNHEYYSKVPNEIRAFIREYGIIVLQGDISEFELNGESIQVCGVDDRFIGETRFDRQLGTCGRLIDKKMYSILLSHRPELYREYLKYEFDLVLAGHAHGGQWRIPKLINGVFSPGQGLFPKYAGGYYDFGKTKMIVSRGLAKESTIIPRIFNRPEIVIININKKISNL